ncbi:MAG: hypothetical protein M0R06_06490 [Sphaerochaeta sp.]|jgi:hypothetical protein|nr:hypothetical protein [Sphaerochaeta sp.]MDD4985139.1 hypothetical protein [Dehalococcoidales bacterium]
MSSGYPDFYGDKAEVMTRADWATIKGTQKILEYGKDPLAAGGFVDLTYNVPAGKVLYIVQYSASMIGYAAGDRELIQSLLFEIEDATTYETLIQQSGQGGINSSLLSPLKIPGGHTFYSIAQNFSNHSETVDIVIIGFEV